MISADHITRGASISRPLTLTNAEDLRILFEGFRQARRIFATDAFASVVVNEINPGPAVTSDAEIESFARAQGAKLYHPVGTFRLGVDEMAVVDPQFCLRGAAGASIMPFLPTGNTNVLTIMIAERAADLLLADWQRAC